MKNWKFGGIGAAALALFSVLVIAQQGLAADEKAHEGMVVSAGEGKLTMTMKGNAKEHTHAVAKDATITLDGKPAKLADVKKGHHVIVTMHGDHGIVKLVAHSKTEKP